MLHCVDKNKKAPGLSCNNLECKVHVTVVFGIKTLEK